MSAPSQTHPPTSSPPSSGAATANEQQSTGGVHSDGRYTPMNPNYDVTARDLRLMVHCLNVSSLGDESIGGDNVITYTSEFEAELKSIGLDPTICRTRIQSCFMHNAALPKPLPCSFTTLEGCPDNLTATASSTGLVSTDALTSKITELETTKSISVVFAILKKLCINIYNVASHPKTQLGYLENVVRSKTIAIRGDHSHLGSVKGVKTEPYIVTPHSWYNTSMMPYYSKSVGIVSSDMARRKHMPVNPQRNNERFVFVSEAIVMLVHLFNMLMLAVPKNCLEDVPPMESGDSGSSKAKAWAASEMRKMLSMHVQAIDATKKQYIQTLIQNRDEDILKLPAATFAEAIALIDNRFVVLFIDRIWSEIAVDFQFSSIEDIMRQLSPPSPPSSPDQKQQQEQLSESMQKEISSMVRNPGDIQRLSSDQFNLIAMVSQWINYFYQLTPAEAERHREDWIGVIPSEVYEKYTPQQVEELKQYQFVHEMMRNCLSDINLYNFLATKYGVFVASMSIAWPLLPPNYSETSQKFYEASEIVRLARQKYGEPVPGREEDISLVEARKLLQLNVDERMNPLGENSNGLLLNQLQSHLQKTSPSTTSTTAPTTNSGGNNGQRTLNIHTTSYLPLVAYILKLTCSFALNCNSKLLHPCLNDIDNVMREVSMSFDDVVRAFSTGHLASFEHKFLHIHTKMKFKCGILDDQGNDKNAKATAASSPHSQETPPDMLQIMKAFFGNVPVQAAEIRKERVIVFVNMLEQMISFTQKRARPEDLLKVQPEKYVELIATLKLSDPSALESQITSKWYEMVRPFVVIISDFAALIRAKEEFDHFIKTNYENNDASIDLRKEFSTRKYFSLTIKDFMVRLKQNLEQFYIAMIEVLKRLQERLPPEVKQAINISEMGAYYIELYKKAKIGQDNYQNLVDFLRYLIQLNLLSVQIYQSNDVHLHDLGDVCSFITKMAGSMGAAGGGSGAPSSSSSSSTGANPLNGSGSGLFSNLLSNAPALVNEFKSGYGSLKNKKTGEFDFMLFQRNLNLLTAVLNNRSMQLIETISPSSDTDPRKLKADHEAFVPQAKGILGVLAEIFKTFEVSLEQSKAKKEFCISDDEDVLSVQDMFSNGDDNDDDGANDQGGF